jgi:hypothetical protein
VVLRSEQGCVVGQSYGIPAWGIRQVYELTVSKWVYSFALLVAVGYALLGVAPAAQATNVGYQDFAYGTGVR